MWCRFARIAAWIPAFAGMAGYAGVASADPTPLKGGIEFQSADVRALQADSFGNPGLLWIERGEALWKTPPAKGAPSCAACHGDGSSMKGAAARYPRYSPGLRQVVNLEGRINSCVIENQHATAYAWESPELLSLTAFVASQSNGVPVEPDTQPESRSAYQRGRTLYFERQGQLNLACTHCHDQSWGKTLLAEPISQGHPVDWPAYRLEWQSLGSLSRRLRACYFGVRAEQPAYGSPDIIALELYLAKRASGLQASVPGVRR
jgi:L-cysteine S-thiosulfotransferase